MTQKVKKFKGELIVKSPIAPKRNEQKSCYITSKIFSVFQK